MMKVVGVVMTTESVDAYFLLILWALFCHFDCVIFSFVKLRPSNFTTRANNIIHSFILVTYIQFHGITFYLILVLFVSLHQKYGIPYLLTFCSLKHSLHLDVIYRPTTFIQPIVSPYCPLPSETSMHCWNKISYRTDAPVQCITVGHF